MTLGNILVFNTVFHNFDFQSIKLRKHIKTLLVSLKIGREPFQCLLLRSCQKLPFSTLTSVVVKNYDFQH